MRLYSYGTKAMRRNLQISEKSGLRGYLTLNETSHISSSDFASPWKICSNVFCDKVEGYQKRG